MDPVILPLQEKRQRQQAVTQAVTPLGAKQAVMRCDQLSLSMLQLSLSVLQLGPWCVPVVSQCAAGFFSEKFHALSGNEKQ